MQSQMKTLTGWSFDITSTEKWLNDNWKVTFTVISVNIQLLECHMFILFLDCNFRICK